MDVSPSESLRCRICLLTEDETQKELISNICNCKGASGSVHIDCLERWLANSDRRGCELCLREIDYEREPKFGLIVSIGVFFCLNRTSQILVVVIIAGITIYILSVMYIDRLSSRPNDIPGKVLFVLAHLSIFGSVFVISYSPLICLYIWDLWKQWKKTQYIIRIRGKTSVIDVV